MILDMSNIMVGHKVLAKAGLKKISMELGSNCPPIVMDDADMELALESTVSGDTENIKPKEVIRSNLR